MRRLLTTIMAAMMLAACDDAEEQYSSTYPCVFTFDTQYHLTSLLTLALDNPGSYVKVEVSLTQGVHRLAISSNNGRDTESITISTDRENYQIGSVGADDCIIVGCSTFNGLRAYDGQCPNCLSDYTGNSFPLTWTSNGQAVECAKCGRTYELNYDGRSDDGSKALLQYRVTYGGSGTVLAVRN